MVTYEEALKIVLERITPLETEEKPLLDSIGQVSAEDIFSDYSFPFMDTSEPDGYAVRSADIATASKTTPVKLGIIEVVKAGSLPKKQVTRGTAIRIMTGSTLPSGADCVVRFEDTDEPANKSGPNKNNPAKVEIYVALSPGDSVNKAGAYIKKDALLLPKGSIIGPIQLSVLTRLGKTKIKVYRRPVIAVISTGDELIEAGEVLPPAKSFDCNTGTIKALINYYGGIPLVLGIAQDTEESLRSALHKGLKADAIITSGGVAKGDFDLVRLILEKNGKVFFSRINVVPGASFSFGEYNSPKKDKANSIPVFALAGPPNGCAINFEILVRAALLKMLGFEKTDAAFVEAIADDDVLRKKPMIFVKWTDIRLVNNQYHVKLNASREAGQIVSMINANSMTIIPANEEVHAGDKIHVLPLPLGMLASRSKDGTDDRQ